MVPRRQLFLPWTFIASIPPIVGSMVPVTTGGHHPSAITNRHNAPRLTPGSTPMIPDSGSHSRILLSSDRSRTTDSERSAASP